MKFTIKIITWDLEIEENMFSNTFQTSKAEVHPTVSAEIDGERVELMKVNKAFSFDLQSM